MYVNCSKTTGIKLLEHRDENYEVNMLKSRVMDSQNVGYLTT